MVLLLKSAMIFFLFLNFVVIATPDAVRVKHQQGILRMEREEDETEQKRTNAPPPPPVVNTLECGLKGHGFKFHLNYMGFSLLDWLMNPELGLSWAQ